MGKALSIYDLINTSIEKFNSGLTRNQLQQAKKHRESFCHGAVSNFHEAGFQKLWGRAERKVLINFHEKKNPDSLVSSVTYPYVLTLIGVEHGRLRLQQMQSRYAF